MPFKFTSEPVEFLTEYRNGSAFDQNEDETTYYIRGNVGDLVQVREEITVECIVNEYEVIEMTYTSVDGKIVAPGTNFIAEGLFIGATIQLIVGEDESETTILNITGTDWNTIFIDTTGMDFLTDGDYNNIILRLKDAPTYIRWDYGLIRDDVASSSESNYASPLDGNPQAYYESGIVAPSSEFFEMTRFGPYVAWDLTESIAVAFSGTTGDYYHTYIVYHSFRISPFRAGEETNVTTLAKPDDLSGSHTYKYARKVSLGFSTSAVGSVSSLGMVGDVGYYHENYNGKPNIFAIDSTEITNDEATETFEVTESNDVTIVLTCDPGVFVQPQKFILWMLRCPAATEYENNMDETWPEVLIWDSVTQEAGEAPVDSDFLKQVSAAYDDVDQMTISFSVEYSAAQQDKISDGDRYIIGIAIGQDGLDASDENNVTLRYTGLYSKDNDVLDLISRDSILLHDSFAAYAGDRAFTDQKTWNGCWVGARTTFDLAQFNDGRKSRIKKAQYRFVLVKDDEYAILAQMEIPVFPYSDFPSSDYSFQLFDNTVIPFLNLPASEDLNQVTAQSVPTFGPGDQTVILQASMRMPWRDWVENLEIPISFFDATEPNNNRNQKTSNYSGVDGYAVYAEFYLEVEYIKPPTTFTMGGKTFTAFEVPTTTVYQLRSNEIEVIDFNLDGNPSVVFSHTIQYFNEGGTEVFSLSTTLVRLVKITITHDQGTLSLQDIAAEIWFDIDGGSGETWQLHTDKDWNIESNIVTGSQELDPDNTDYVEIESNNNEVILYCKTNPSNMIEGIDYIPYFRLEKQSV